MSVERLERLGRTAWWLTFTLYLLQVVVWSLGLAVGVTWLVWSGYGPDGIYRGVPGIAFYLGALLILGVRFRHLEWRRPSVMRVAEAIERQRARGLGRELSTQVSMLTEHGWRGRSSEELVEAALAGVRSRLDIDGMPSPISWKRIGGRMAMLGMVSSFYVVPFLWLGQSWMVASRVVWLPWSQVELEERQPKPVGDSWSLKGQELVVEYPLALHLPKRRFGEFPQIPPGSKVEVVACLGGSLEGTSIEIESTLEGGVPRWQLGEGEGELILGGEEGGGYVVEESQSWRIGVGADVRSVQVWRDLPELLVVADRAPEVEVYDKGKVLTLSREGKVASDFMASDDYGLARVEVFWEVMRPVSRTHGVSGREVLYRWEEVSGREPEPTWRGVWKSNLVGMYAFEPGDVLTYWVEAADLQGQVSSSLRSEVTIVSPESLLQPMLADVSVLQKRLEQCERWQSELVMRLRRREEEGESDIGVDKRAVGLESQVQENLLRRVDSVVSQIDALVDRGNEQQLGATSTMANLRAMGVEVVQLDTILEEILARLAGGGRLPIDEVVRVEEAIVGWIDRLKGVSELVSRQNVMEAMASDQLRLRDATARLLADARSELSMERQREVSESLSQSQQELSERMAGFLRELVAERSKGGTVFQQGDAQREAGWLSALQSRDTLARMRQVVAALQSYQPERALPIQQELAEELKEIMVGSGAANSSSGAAQRMELLRGLVSRQAQVVAACLEDAEDEVNFSEELSRQQEAVMELCRTALEGEPSRAGVVEWVGKTAMAAMERGAGAIRRGERKTEGHLHAQQGLDRLKSIVGALMAESTSSDDTIPTEGSEADKSSGAASSESGIPLYQQLVLLREVQDSIRERLEVVSGASRDRKLNPREWLEVNQLANQQNELLAELQKLGEGLRKSKSVNEAEGKE